MPFPNYAGTWGSSEVINLETTSFLGACLLSRSSSGKWSQVSFDITPPGLLRFIWAQGRGCRVLSLGPSDVSAFISFPRLSPLLPAWTLFLVGIGLGEMVEGVGREGNLALIPNVFSQILCLF